MRAVVVQRVHDFVDDVLRRVEVWLADFEVDDIAPQLLQRLGAPEDLNSSFRAEAVHAGCESHLATLHRA